MTTPPRKGHVKRIYPDPTDPGGIWYDVLRFDKLPLDVKGVGTGARYTVVNQPQWLDKDKENNNPARKMAQVDLKNPQDTDQTQKAWAINQMSWSGRGDGDGDSHQTVKWNFDNNSPDDQVNNPSDPVNTRRTGKAARVHSNDLDDLLDMSQIQTWDDYLNALNKGTQDTNTYIDFEICKKFTVDNRPGDLYQTQTYALANDPVIKLFDATPDSVSPKDISRLDPLQIVVNVSWVTPACVIATNSNQIYYASKPDKWMEFDLPYVRDVEVKGDYGNLTSLPEEVLAGKGVIEDISLDIKSKTFLITYHHILFPDTTDLYTEKVGFKDNKWTLSHTFTQEFEFFYREIQYYVQSSLIIAFRNGDPTTPVPYSVNDGLSWNSGVPSSALKTGLVLPAPVFVQTDHSTSPVTKKTYYLQTTSTEDPKSSPLGRAYKCTLCDINGSVLRTLTGPTPDSECYGMTAGNGKLVGLFLTNPDFDTDFGFLNQDDVGSITGFTDADRNNPLQGSVGGQFQTGTNQNDGADQNWVIGVSTDGTSWATSTKVSDPHHASDEIDGFTPSPGLEWPEFRSWLFNGSPPILPFNVAPASSFATGVIDFAPGWNLFVFASNRYETDTYSESVPVAGRTNEGNTAASNNDFLGLYGWPQVLTLSYIYPTPLQIYTSPDGVNWTQRFKGTWSNGTTPPVPPSNPIPNKMTAYEMINPSPTPHGGLGTPPLAIGKDGGSTFAINGLPQGIQLVDDPSGSGLETLAGALASFNADVAATYPGPPAGSGSISLGGASITVTLFLDTTQTINYDVVEYSFAFDYTNQNGVPDFDDLTPAAIATAGWSYPIKKTT